MLRLVLYVVLLIVAADSFQWFQDQGEDCQEVVTESGIVRGCSGHKEEHYTFLGIPYAAPPTGSSRFKPPNRAYSWSGVYEADRIVQCPQRGSGTEDCLVVNIFAPIKLLNNSAPVLVYFHGGSFLTGSGPVRGANFLVKQNVIVVTVNYRLGALGFLCLGTETAPGNAGLKDQVAALQWIRRNIANFGGDPNEVTIYGMSAGGASVELLVLSEQTKGLFKRAIVESGSATSVWAIDHDPINTAIKVAEKLKIVSKNVNVLGSYYQRVHPKELSQVSFSYYNTLTNGNFGFVPCVERESNTSNAFITKSPHEILLKGEYNKVPMMFLFSTLEGLFLRSSEYYQQNYKKRMVQNFLDFLPGDLNYDTLEIKAAIADYVKDFYFGNKTIGEDINQYLDYFGDYLIMHGLLNSAELHSRNENPVFLMEFAYKGELGSYEKFYDNINVAGHGDVIKYAILNKQPETKDDKKIVARVVKLIANFVKFGNPVPKRSHILPILWPEVKPGNVACLLVDQDTSVVDEPHWDAKEFWDRLYHKYRKKILPVSKSAQP